MSTALLIIHENVEEMEAITPWDLLRRGGVDLTVASREDSLTVKAKEGATLTADISLEEALKKDYDCIILPGGPGVMQLKDDERVLDAVKSYAARGKLVAAICAAPLVLQNAGVLEGKSFTAHFSVQNTLPALEMNAPVVEDGNLVTSQGPGTAIPFSLKILERLEGQDAVEQVKKAICLTS